MGEITMDAATHLAQAAQARLSLTNQWIIKVDGLLHKAAEQGWPNIHCDDLLKEPDEVQERVMAYFKDRGFQAYKGCYYGGFDVDIDTIWFSSLPAKVKEPGVFSSFVSRLFGGKHA